jgi:hypothetical protein
MFERIKSQKHTKTNNTPARHSNFHLTYLKSIELDFQNQNFQSIIQTTSKRYITIIYQRNKKKLNKKLNFQLNCQ